jgi:hypothetical protein
MDFFSSHTQAYMLSARTDYCTHGQTLPSPTAVRNSLSYTRELEETVLNTNDLPLVAVRLTKDYVSLTMERTARHTCRFASLFNNGP